MNEIPELQGEAHSAENPFEGPMLPTQAADIAPQVNERGVSSTWMKPFTEVVGRFHIAAEKLTVKSAINPVLWLCAIMSPLFLGATYFFRGDPFLKILFGITSVAPVAVACILCIGFAVFAPDRLQSEFYQLRQRLMQVVQERAGRFSIESLIQAISNPRDRDAE